MSDKQIFEKVMERYRKSTGDDRVFVPSNDIIIFLENEIDSYREKIAHSPEVLEAVQENTACEIIKTLSDSGFDSISINIYKSKEE